MINNPKILLLGYKGLLGNALSRILTESGIDFDRYDYPEIDAASSNPLSSITKNSYTHLINCIAYTNVNRAEIDYKESLLINSSFLRDLSCFCNDNGTLVVNISSSYIFSGLKDTDYKETDSPDPLNMYGISKYAGEMILKQYSKNYLIIRTADLFGKSGIGKKSIVDRFIEMLKAGSDIYVVDNEYTSPTYALSLAKQIVLLIQNEVSGIYNATSMGSCNWVEFLEQLKKYFADTKSKLIPVSSDYFAGAKKPLNAVLSKDKLIREGLCIMQNWRKDLDDYLGSLTY